MFLHFGLLQFLVENLRVIHLLADLFGAWLFDGAALLVAHLFLENGVLISRAILVFGSTLLAASGSLVIRTVLIIVVLLAFHLEQIKQTVGAANKVRMISVDMCIFYFDQVGDHGSGWREALIQHLLHYITNTRLQSIVARQLGYLDADG